MITYRVTDSPLPGRPTSGSQTRLAAMAFGFTIALLAGSGLIGALVLGLLVLLLVRAFATSSAR